MMAKNNMFSGKIIQVTESLDYGDAVSNQIISLDDIFKGMGIDSNIYAKFHHEKVADRCSLIDDLSASDRDLVIYHFSGFSKHSLGVVLRQNCTRILMYHNVTPHHFFEEGTPLFDLCYEGRQQLREVLSGFHYFWADSEYNLNELKEMGVSPVFCAVIPIVVPPVNDLGCSRDRQVGNWLYVGRIAANKGQVELVKLFADLHESSPDLARHLYLVGNYSEEDSYFKSLKQIIFSLGVEDCVTLTSKVSDNELKHFYSKASIYVSMSEHEGFGVPLIEAPLKDLPVVALNNTAIGETMGGVLGLADDIEEVKELIIRLFSDSIMYQIALAEQKNNAQRFSFERVSKKVADELNRILPKADQFNTVSVVICTFNRRDYLERCLDYLRYQSCGSFEVIVIDGPSNDGTKELLEKYKDIIKIAHNPEANLSKSRNMGIDLSDGDIVAFIDDDAIPFDDWVEVILNEYNSRPMTTVGLGGPVYYAGSLRFQCEDIGFNEYAEALVNINSNLIGRDGWVRSLLGTNSTFVRSALDKVGGFDEQFDYFLDESELCFRLQKQGGVVAYEPELYLRHEFAQSNNRSGKYDYNWFTICKNTAYFIAAYSGLENEDLRVYLKDRFQRERVSPLDEAVIAKELSPEIRDKYVKAIWSGMEQGLSDVKSFPRTRRIASAPRAFQSFPLQSSYIRVLHEVKRLHICILSKEFPPFTKGGGVGTLYYHLVSELLLMGHHITVVVPGDEGGNTLTQGHLQIVYVQNNQLNLGGVDSVFRSNLQWSLNALNALSKIHLLHPIDVVDTALWDTEALAFSLLSDRPPIVLRLVTPFPVAARTNQWNVSSATSAFFTEAESTLIKSADAVVPISESIAQTIECEYSIQRDSRWSLSHCGVAYWPSFDVTIGYREFQELDNIPRVALESPKIILFIGRLERRKGIDLLIDAAPKFLSNDESAQLIIAGRDVEGWGKRSLESLPNKLFSRIHFLGEVSDATREKLLARAYCLIFPSRYESFGLVPLEAFVHGVPVIASRSGAIPEVVAHEQCGLLFDPESADSLTDCVTQIVSNPELRQKLAEGAKAQSHFFSSRQTAIKTVEIYKNLLSHEEMVL